VRHHWLELIAIVPLDFILEDHTFGLARVLRLARFIRLMRMVVLLWRLSGPVSGLLRTNGLGYVLVFILGLVIIGGTVIWAVEPEIETVGDGVWWSLVTATTVGYGDIAPKTPLGRGVAAMLIVAGLCTFSMLTGAITTYALARKRVQNPYIRHIITQLEEWEFLTPEERRHVVALLEVLAQEVEKPQPMDRV
jgi:voltage-gated potassium channel